MTLTGLLTLAVALAQTAAPLQEDPVLARVQAGPGMPPSVSYELEPYPARRAWGLAFLGANVGHLAPWMVGRLYLTQVGYDDRVRLTASVASYAGQGVGAFVGGVKGARKEYAAAIGAGATLGLLAGAVPAAPWTVDAMNVTRGRPFLSPREVLLYLGLAELGFSLTATGAALGGRLAHGPLFVADLHVQPVLSPDGAQVGLSVSGRW